MTLLSLHANIECDACGRQFKVECDPARKPVAGWSWFDLAEDEVRGGHIHSGSDGSCMVEEGQMLCGECASKAVTDYIEAHPDRISGVRPEGDGYRVDTYGGGVYLLTAAMCAGRKPEFEQEVANYGVRP